MNSKRIRFSLLVIALGFGGVFLYPTVKWYFFVSPAEKEIANQTRERIRETAKEQAQASYQELTALVKENPEGAVPEKFSFLIKKAKQLYKLADRKAPSQWTLRTLLVSFGSGAALFRQLEETRRDEILANKDLQASIIQLGLDLSGGLKATVRADKGSLKERLNREPTNEDLRDAMDRSLEILNTRVDKFGVTEPQIRRQSQDEILIEIPGEGDLDRIERLLVGKGRLNFHLVDSEASDALRAYLVSHPDYNPLTDSLPEEAPFNKVGSRVMGYYQKDAYGLDTFQGYFIVRDEVVLSGGHIVDALVQRNPTTGRPVITTRLDGEGGEIFFKFTSENKGRVVAIVLDDKVRAALTIRDVIRDSGQIEGFDDESARDLAIVLRTAALPVDLEITSTQVVGASLGSDTIALGFRAIFYGLVAVLVFMAVYYKGAGLLADVVLVINLLLIMAVLSSFSMTLTMTSIAGLILTIGMAVDANVIIFERIREELRLGKTRSGAIEAGFKKAFWTIMDANITTFIAAIFLSQLGKGPVQGFAVMLAVGIVCSLFTAIFVSRLIFDFFTDVFNLQKISIGWRIKQ